MTDSSWSRDHSHNEIIRSLYLELKGKSKKFSLSYLCQRAGIPSKGYLGDVMKGARKLNLKYALPLGKALGLTGPRLKLFVLRVKLDQYHEPELLQKVERDIASLEKVLSIQYRQIQGKMNLRLMSKVFCLFNILQPPITLKRLQPLFPNEPHSALAEVLRQLTDLKAIEQREEGFVQVTSQVMIPEGSGSEELIEYLKASLNEASGAAAKWFSLPEQSYFESSVLSVKKDVYLKRLPEIKEFFNRIQSDIESEKADALVYFNVQIYPED